MGCDLIIDVHIRLLIQSNIDITRSLLTQILAIDAAYLARQGLRARYGTSVESTDPWLYLTPVYEIVLRP